MAAGERAPPAARRRVAIVAADAGRLVQVRRPLLEALISRGHKLLCVTGAATSASAAELTELGAETAVLAHGDPQLRLIGDREGVESLTRTLADWTPSVVLGIGLKPMVMAGLAARRLKSPRIVLVTPTLAGVPRGNARPNIAIRWMARRALRAAHALVVHNREHARALEAFGVLPAALPVFQVFGAGVDLAKYAPQPLPSIESGLVFTMITRLDEATGVVEFCEAARRVRGKTPNARFVLAITPSTGLERNGGLDLARFSDAVEQVTATNDTRPLLAGTHVVVLPSRTEGLAHEIVEALACGRPAIVSNIPGCREIVDERVSGVLVPPGDPAALTAAIESFMRRPEQLAWMAQASRRKAERRFDANTLTLELLEIMELVNRAS